MAFSGRQTIVFILLLFIPVMIARSQSAVDKAAGSTISGKVTVGGKGLPGVVVGLVISDQYRSNVRPTRFRSTTDEEGYYRITNVPPGTYDVIPASSSYVAIEGRKSLVIGKNETVENFDIALDRGGVITGKVTDAEGRPVIEEIVYVSSVGRTQRLSYFRNIRTDDRGIYRAYGIPAGRYVVSAGRDANSSAGSRRGEGAYQKTYHPSAADVASATVITISDGSEATNIDITLGGAPRTYTARGRIIDSETDKPLPNTRVGLQTFMQYGMSAMGGVAESNKNGEFKLENLPPGKYAVYSEPPADSDWHSEAVKFDVTDQDIEGLVIKTFRGASVSGVVVLEGTDDPKLRATLLGSRIVGHVDGYLGRSNPSGAINPNGGFRLTGLAAGTLMFHLDPHEPLRLIRIERDGIIYPRGVEIKSHEQVNGLRVVFAHANGSIRGTITPPAGVELPASVRISITARRIEDQTPGYYGSPVEADARGRFRVDGLVAGTYEISVRVFMSGPAAQPLNIPVTRQTVVVTHGAVADVTIALQAPKPTPQ